MRVQRLRTNEVLRRKIERERDRKPSWLSVRKKVNRKKVHRVQKVNQREQKDHRECSQIRNKEKERNRKRESRKEKEKRVRLVVAGYHGYRWVSFVFLFQISKGGSEE